MTPAKKTEARSETGIRPENEALFLLNLLAYGILYLGPVLIEPATRREFSRICCGKCNTCYASVGEAQERMRCLPEIPVPPSTTIR